MPIKNTHPSQFTPIALASQGRCQQLVLNILMIDRNNYEQLIYLDNYINNESLRQPKNLDLLLTIKRWVIGRLETIESQNKIQINKKKYNE